METHVLERLGFGELRFRVHSTTSDEENVSASVFADKLGRLVRALKAADLALHGKVIHDYKIAKLSSSNPTAVLAETVLPKFIAAKYIGGDSAIAAFDDCASAILSGDRDRALRYGACAFHISKLATGSHKNFGYAEVWTANDNIVRVDDLLVHQAKAIIAPPKTPELEAYSGWFKGQAFGSFEGTVLEADLRGALPSIKLVLSAGGEQIDCVCRPEDIEMIREALKRRVRLYGNAIYDGRSGLPKRIQVSDIQPVAQGDDLSRWKDSFEEIEPPEWDGDMSD